MRLFVYPLRARMLAARHKKQLKKTVISPTNNAALD